MRSDMTEPLTGTGTIEWPQNCESLVTAFKDFARDSPANTPYTNRLTALIEQLVWTLERAPVEGAKFHATAATIGGKATY